VKLNQKQTLLVIVDVQEKLAPLMVDNDQLINNLSKIIQGVQCLDIPIIHTEQYPEGLGHTVGALQKLIGNQSPIEKNSFSCCQVDKFIKAIETQERSQLLLAGIEAHICVYQTALDLIDRGYQVHLLTDCIASRTPANLNLARQRLSVSGVQLTGLEMALFELLGSSQVNGFKTISKLIK